MENRTTPYILKQGALHLVFPSEGAACEYLGVSKTTVASCFRSKCKCKGYEVIRGVPETDLYNDSRLRRIWESMHARCEYQRHPHYGDYGGRGISVCAEWDLYLPFAKWAFKNGYSIELTLDRIDVDGNYCPSNCRWASQREQQNNKRNNRNITYNGETHTLTVWAEMLGMGKTTLKERLNNGWTVEKAFNTPVRSRSTREEANHETTDR